MAQCSQTAAEFVTSVFRPRVAVMAAPEVDALCMKNSLSLAELLQPFCKLQTEVQYRDPLGTPVTLRDLQLRVDDWQTAAPPPAPAARRQLAASVADCLPPPPADDGSVRPDTPWFEAWRERLLQVEPPGEHEFVRRYVCCVLAVSSCSAEPLQQLQQLAQQQHQLQHGQPDGGHRWFANNVFIYHLLVTDASSAAAESGADDLFEQVRSAYGAHCCHHLRLNSRPPERQEPHSPDPWAAYVRCRPTHASEVTPAQLSGADTPAAVADLTSLPSLVVEGVPTPAAADHPLSPDSRAASPPPTAAVAPAPPPEPADAGCVVSDPAAPPVVVNRVSYPTPASSTAGAVQGHGACLSASDLDRITIFISELCVRGLLPHVERQMRALSDMVSNRKGVSRSLISATKRWFGGNKPGAAAAVTSVIYSQEAPEIQVRRLGDLAFMFGHYDLAYQAYHSAKRDFNGDSAWLHFAGAVEMAALSAFLHAGVGKPFPQHYLDQAISTYLDACKVPNYALRATLFSTECLKARGQFAEAALQFIRLTAEDADLRSALLLEQAAHCFLNSQPPRLRKYAFHMILCGHRFSKAGQRRHSLRAYKQAFQVYEGHGWRLADDHIDFTLGRHCENLQEHGAALASLGRLLAGAAASEGRQTAAQQATFVREYMHVHKHQSAAESPSPPLPLPTVLSQQTRVLVGGDQPAAADGWTPASGVTFADDEDDNARWFRLEQLCLEHLGHTTNPFRPTVQCMTAKTANTHSARVCASEPIRVQLVLRNPLRVPLELSELRLQYSFVPGQPDGDRSDGDRSDGDRSRDDRSRDHRADAVTADTLVRCLLEENSTQEVTLTITAHVPGQLTILGYEFSLALAAAEPGESVQSQEPPMAVRGSQPISVRGRRLNGTKEERAGVVYAEDRRLQVAVEEAGARLQLSFRRLPTALMCGQIQPVLMRLANAGRRPVSRLLIATPEPQLLSVELQPPPGDDRWQQVRAAADSPPPPPASARSWAEAARIGRVAELPLPAGGLAVGAALTRRLWLRAPHSDGAQSLEVLLCAADGAPRPRLLRHASRLLVTPSLAVAVRAGRSAGPGCRLQLDVQVTGVQPAAAAITLEALAVAANGWRLDTRSPPPAVRVVRGETAFLGVTVERVPVQISEGGHPLLNLASLSLDGQQCDVSASPSVDFLLRHKVSLPALVAPLAAAGVADPAAGRRQAEELADAVNVGATVLLHWRTQGVDAAGRETTVHGQHHVTAELLGDSAATYPSSEEPEPRPPVTIIPTATAPPVPAYWPGEAVMDRLVSVVPLHRSTVEHDFARKRLCVIPVTMLVQNHSSCDLVVHMSAGMSSPRTTLPYSSHVSADLVWVGRTHPCVTVPAAGSARLRLAAAVTRPGLYDLGSVGVACRRLGGADSELTEQTARAESAVVVSDVAGGGRGQ